MKKIIITLYAVFSVLTVSSCRDAIDIVQDGEINREVAFQRTSDLRSFLNGTVYGAMNTNNEIALTSYFTDETGVAPSNSGWYFDEHRYFLNTDNAFVAGTWGSQYLVINRVNRLLEAAELITPAASEVNEYNTVLAEARALRAFAYLELQSYFTTDMRDDNALGVILSTTVPSTSDQLPRAKNGEIYKQIEDDLTFAEANLKVLRTGGDAYKFVTPNLIDAIRARMYAYRGKYALAKQYAQKVVDNFPNGLTKATPLTTTTEFYSPGTANPYRQMWNDGIQGEIIFALSRPSAGTWGQVASNWTTNTTNIEGSPLYDMGRNLFNIINVAGDVRRYAFIDPTSKISATYMTDANYVQTDVLVIDKYPGKGNTPLRNDIKVFRLSEMYFILAEAAVDAGDIVSAATYIQAVRSARKFTAGAAALPVYTSVTAAWQDILKERRAELALEGHRYVDLRRLGKIAGVSIDRNKVDDISQATPLTLPITDHRFTFPIPQLEILGNPSIQQNPGY